MSPKKGVLSNTSKGFCSSCGRKARSVCHGIEWCPVQPTQHQPDCNPTQIRKHNAILGVSIKPFDPKRKPRIYLASHNMSHHLQEATHETHGCDHGEAKQTWVGWTCVTEGGSVVFHHFCFRLNTHTPPLFVYVLLSGCLFKAPPSEGHHLRQAVFGPGTTCSLSCLLAELWQSFLTFSSSCITQWPL